MTQMTVSVNTETQFLTPRFRPYFTQSSFCLILTSIAVNTYILYGAIILTKICMFGLFSAGENDWSLPGLAPLAVIT